MNDAIIDQRQVPFAMIETEILRNSAVKPHLKALYGLLISYGPQRIFPGQQRLADEMGVTRPCMNRWLQDLRATGLIDWEQRTGTSNLYVILGLGGCNRTVTGGVTEGLQEGVTEGLHDLDPSDLDPPSDQRAPARTAANPPKEGIVEYTFTEGDEPVRECTNCWAEINLTRLRKSAGRCPGCGVAVRVTDEDGNVIVKVPQGARERSNGLKEWLPAVRAFCDLASVPYGKLDGGTRGKWARRMQDLAGDDGPEAFAETIPKLREYVYQIQDLDNPFMDRFAMALLEYRMIGPTEEAVWLARLKSLYAVPWANQMQLAERFSLEWDGEKWRTMYGEPLDRAAHSEAYSAP